MRVHRIQWKREPVTQQRNYYDGRAGAEELYSSVRCGHSLLLLADLLPARLRRAPKRGFVLPDTLWLRGALRPLVERLLSPDRLKRQGLLDPRVYETDVRPHLEGRRDRGSRVWTLMMFELWHSVLVERPTLDPPAFSWRDIA